MTKNQRFLMWVIIILILWAFGASISRRAHAQATEPLTLTCQGTYGPGMFEDDHRPQEPVSMGIIISLTNKTVHGFSLNEPAKIDDITETVIHFSLDHGSMPVRGNMDRVTGDVFAYSVLGKSLDRHWVLKCKPTQRMF